MEEPYLPQKLIDKLLSRHSKVQVSDVLRYVERLKQNLCLNPFQTPYSREVLFEDERGEILFMRWAKNVFCNPHDHASAVGYVVLLEGEFVERDYEFDQTLVRNGSRKVSSPGIFPFERNRIHDMKCMDEGYSLHIYKPSITGMKVYDLERRRTLCVDDSCGAWIPNDAYKILDVQFW